MVKQTLIPRTHIFDRDKCSCFCFLRRIETFSGYKLFYFTNPDNFHNCNCRSVESSRRNLKTQEKIAAEIGSKVQRFGGFKNAFVLFEDAKTEENIRRSSPLPVGDILKANERLETQVVEHFKRIQISIDS